MDKRLKEEYESGHNKETLIERVWDKLVFALNRDIKVTFLALSILLNFYLFGSNKDCNEIRVEDKIEQYNEILEILLPTINRTIDDKVEQKVDENTKMIESKVDSINLGVNDMVQKIDNIIR